MGQRWPPALLKTESHLDKLLQHVRRHAFHLRLRPSQHESLTVQDRQASLLALLVSAGD
jgi:hypothetical protein